MEVRTYTVNIEPCEEGGYWAYVPALPGCFTQGETLDEIVRMAQEAVEGFVEVLAEKGQELPVEQHQPFVKPAELEINRGSCCLRSLRCCAQLFGSVFRRSPIESPRTRAAPWSNLPRAPRRPPEEEAGGEGERQTDAEESTGGNAPQNAVGKGARSLPD